MAEHTFTARRLDTALARVKRELGADALILSSGRRRDPDGDTVEVRAIAAADAAGWREPGADGGEPADLVESLLRKNGVAGALAQRLAIASGGRARTLRGAMEGLVTALRANLAFRAAPTRGAVALVGPTGAGKTTTLAKLAAEAALVQRRKVALVTLDGYRVGATAQLEAYADLIGIPMLVARDADGFARALRRLADADVVFVDTAGRSPRDAEAHLALAEILQSSGQEVEVTLCMQAATRTDEMTEIVERHAVLRPTSVTLTKLDEARSFDALVHAPMTSGLPLAWLTTGQRVPEDIEAATPERLAAALCGEEVYG